MSQKQSRIHTKRAKKHQSMGALSKAVDEYQNALDQDSTNIEAVNGLAELAVKMGMLDVAIQWYDLLVRMHPKNIVKLNRAKVLTKLGRNEEAYFSFLELEPDMSSNNIYLIGFGSLLLNMQMNSEAIEKFKMAAQKGGNIGSCNNNIALAYLQLQDYEKARFYFEEAAKKLKGDVQLQFNWASCLIQMGEITEGWERYKARYHPDFSSSPRWRTDLPRWAGEDLSGKTILIAYEQGVGDMFIYATCINELVDNAKSVVLEVHDKLYDLFRESFPEVHVRRASHKSEHINNQNRTVFTYEWLELEDITPDFFTTFGEAFALMRSSYDRFPLNGHVLKPNTEIRNRYVKVIKDLNPDNLPIVGLSWRSSLMTGSRNSSYSTAEEYAKSIKKIQSPTLFINLQYGYQNSEIEILVSSAKGSQHKFVNLEDVDLYNDMRTTAALISCLDYVVAPNNTQYALASALGIPNVTYGMSLFSFGYNAFDLIFPNSFRANRSWETLLNPMLSGEESYAQMLYHHMAQNGDLDRLSKFHDFYQETEFVDMVTRSMK